jgi:hypothetical protein
VPCRLLHTSHRSELQHVGVFRRQTFASRHCQTIVNEATLMSFNVDSQSKLLRKTINAMLTQ